MTFFFHAQPPQSSGFRRKGRRNGIGFAVLVYVFFIIFFLFFLPLSLFSFCFIFREKERHRSRDAFCKTPTMVCFLFLDLSPSLSQVSLSLGLGYPILAHRQGASFCRILCLFLRFAGLWGGRKQTPCQTVHANRTSIEVHVDQWLPNWEIKSSYWYPPGPYDFP